MANAFTAPSFPRANVVPQTELPVMAYANLPDAKASKGKLVICTNGNAGAACIAVSDGTSWFPVAIGATACATS